MCRARVPSSPEAASSLPSAAAAPSPASRLGQPLGSPAPGEDAWVRSTASPAWMGVFKAGDVGSVACMALGRFVCWCCSWKSRRVPFSGACCHYPSRIFAALRRTALCDVWIPLESGDALLPNEHPILGVSSGAQTPFKGMEQDRTRSDPLRPWSSSQKRRCRSERRRRKEIRVSGFGFPLPRSASALTCWRVRRRGPGWSGLALEDRCSFWESQRKRERERESS